MDPLARSTTLFEVCVPEHGTMMVGGWAVGSERVGSWTPTPEAARRRRGGHSITLAVLTHSLCSESKESRR